MLKKIDLHYLQQTADTSVYKKTQWTYVYGFHPPSSAKEVGKNLPVRINIQVIKSREFLTVVSRKYCSYTHFDFFHCYNTHHIFVCSENGTILNKINYSRTPLIRTHVAYFHTKIQLSGLSAYPEGSPSQLIRISGVLIYISWIFCQLLTNYWCKYITDCYHQIVILTLFCSLWVKTEYLFDTDQRYAPCGLDPFSKWRVENLVPWDSKEHQPPKIISFISVARSCGISGNIWVLTQVVIDGKSCKQ